MLTQFVIVDFVFEIFVPTKNWTKIPTVPLVTIAKVAPVPGRVLIMRQKQPAVRVVDQPLVMCATGRDLEVPLSVRIWQLGPIVVKLTQCARRDYVLEVCA